MFSALLLLFALFACARSSPLVVDYSKLRIMLSRSACYGECPDYRVTILGDGTVEFSTRELPVVADAELHRKYSPTVGVVVPGYHRTKISRETLDALLRQFQDHNFFRLKDEYRAEVTDGPTYVVEIDTGHRKKRVVDYMGLFAGMPKSVTAIEFSIDLAAGTRRWIEGTADVIPLLQAEGARFDSDLGRSLLMAGAVRGELTTIQTLGKLGAPLADPYVLAAAASSNDAVMLQWLLDRNPQKSLSHFMPALNSAVRSGSLNTFELLKAKVHLRSMSRNDATDILIGAARVGNATMVAWVLDQNPRIDGNEEFGAAVPVAEAAGGTCPEDRPLELCDRPRVVRMLLDAGAKIQWSRQGTTGSALGYAMDINVATLLLQAGADVNFRSDEGEPIIFSVYDEDVALAMIAKGLDLKSIRPADKMTVKEWAAYKKWPRVVALVSKTGA